MAQTVVGIVYNAVSGQALRVIIPDDDSELDAAASLQSGEAMVTVAIATYQTFSGPADIQAAVPIPYTPS